MGHGEGEAARYEQWLFGCCKYFKALIPIRYLGCPDASARGTRARGDEEYDKGGDRALFLFFEGFLFYAHPSIGSFQHLLMSAYYRLKRVSPYDGRPTSRTKTLYVRERTI